VWGVEPTGITKDRLGDNHGLPRTILGAFVTATDNFAGNLPRCIFIFKNSRNGGVRIGIGEWADTGGGEKGRGDEGGGGGGYGKGKGSRGWGWIGAGWGTKLIVKQEK
jgi:hypothetical protein